MAWLGYPTVGDAVRVLPWDLPGTVTEASGPWVRVRFANGASRVVPLDALRAVAGQRPPLPLPLAP